MYVTRFDRDYAAKAAELFEDADRLSCVDLAKRYHEKSRLSARYKEDVQRRLSSIRLVLMEDGILTVVVNRLYFDEIDGELDPDARIEAVRHFLPGQNGKGYGLVKVAVVNHCLFRAKAQHDAKRGGANLRAFIRALRCAKNNGKLNLNGAEELLRDYIEAVPEPEKDFLKKLHGEARSTVLLIDGVK